MNLRSDTATNTKKEDCSTLSAQVVDKPFDCLAHLDPDIRADLKEFQALARELLDRHLYMKSK